MGFGLVFMYGITSAAAATIASLFSHGRLISGLSRQTLIAMAVMGLCLFLAMSLQTFAVRNYHHHYQWIMLVGSAGCPLIIVAYAACHNLRLLNLQNCLGMLFVLIGLTLIFLCPGTSPAPKPDVTTLAEADK